MPTKSEKKNCLQMNRDHSFVLDIILPPIWKINGCILVIVAPGDPNGKESALSVGDPGSIPGSGRSLGEGNGQYSCLENTMVRGAWQATVHGAAKSWTRLSN